MASDSISDRRAAWQAALDEIVPQIRGLEDKENDALSEELRAVLKQRLAFLKQRQTLINQAKAAQDAADNAEGALEQHGFPELPDMEIPAVLMEELDKEGADDAAARSGFSATPMATSIGITLGTPTDKPTPGAIMATLSTDQMYSGVTLTIVDAKGRPASVDGVPVWSSSDETVLSVTAAADGMTADINTVAPGTGRVTVSADADLGAGVVEITGVTEDITVTNGSVASVMTLTLPTPTDKP